MSRHRNVRAIDADREYEEYYSYGHSVEEEACISPQTEAQFLYDRSAKQPISLYFESPKPVSNDDSEQEDDASELNDIDTAKLHSCVEAMQDVVGDTIPESILRKAALESNFILENALDYVLKEKAPKPQRIKKPELNTELKPAENMTLRTPTNDSSLKPSDTKIQSLKYAEKVEASEVVKSDKISRGVSPKNVPSPNMSKSANHCLELYNKERKHEKPLISLVVIGHVDAGKSTLMGHLLYRLGQVSKKTMHKFEQDSKKAGKASFMYAWVLDETLEERNRGITMDVAESKFETPHRLVLLLDAPGHKDFIPNMINGAVQADVAILVIDATKGEFETGFESGGQTREHTILIRSLGITQIAVAINKMDNVQWAQERYLSIVSKMSIFLKQVGFKGSMMTFVPCSGLTGENLISPPQECTLKSWYTGPTLIEAIDNFNPPERCIQLPLRLCVGDVFKGSTGGFCVSGKLETGFIKSGDKILVMPSNEIGNVKGVTINNNSSTDHGFAGDQVILQLTGIDANDISCGSVICDIHNPVKVSTRIRARLVIFSLKAPITKGFPVIIHYQNLSEQAVIKKLISLNNRNTGEVVKKNPRCLFKNSSAVVELQIIKSICIELYDDFKNLGRFMLRSGGSTIAAGLVTEIL